ncbi:hypothetical protein M426DRAFT_11871 [Hypoxylon sp. CI-4A]|nr:hypothetical protein M426DRAFT_11871 [Hypoxylon sp. CI-4A]
MSFAELRQLVHGGSLADEELRYLKFLLADSHIDIIAKLPIELLLKIAEYLDLHHFVNCLAVSRQWRNKFLSPSIIGAITRDFHPSLTGLPQGYQVNPDACLNTVHKLGRARWRCFQSTFRTPFALEDETYFKLDPVLHGHHDAYAELASVDRGRSPCVDALQYANGIVAWLTRPWVLVLDNLWTRSRKLFKLPSSPGSISSSIAALGDKLVVCSIDRRLTAWDYTTNDRQEKKLPTAVLHAETKGNKIAVVLLNGDLLLWEFKGAMLTLVTDSLKEIYHVDDETRSSLKYIFRFFFHPTCDETLYLAFNYNIRLAESKQFVMKRVVFEFRGTNLVNTFELEAPLKYRKEPRHTLVSIKRLLPHRRDLIGFRRTSGNLGESDFEPFVEFDMHDRKFAIRENDELYRNELGWPGPDEHSDLDFLVTYDSSLYGRAIDLVVYSLQPGFDFRAGM